MQVIKFGAPWCVPCKMYDPVLAQMATEFPDIQFHEVNVDELDKATLHYWDVMSVPHTVFLHEDRLPEPQDVVRGPIPPAKLRTILS